MDDGARAGVPALSEYHDADTDERQEFHNDEDREGDEGPTVDPSGMLSCAIPCDVNNAYQFARLHIDNVRFLRDLKVWLIWDRHRWTVARRGEEYRMMVATLGAKFTESLDAGDAMAEHYMKSLNDPKINMALRCAANMDTVACTSDQFDADPWKLGTANGTLDLRSGRLSAGSRYDMITRASPIEYDNRAKCWRFDEFLREVYGDEAVIDYVMRFFGYCLTGDVSEERMLVLLGNGANGKNTLVDIVRYILGPLARPLPTGALGKRMQWYTPMIMSECQGRRLVVLNEESRGAELNDGFFKALVSKDPPSGRRIRRDFEPFQPTAKAVMLTNNLPRIRDRTDGTWRRLAVVHHPRRFEIDRTLEPQLRSEAPGILRRLVEGCMEWQRRGLSDMPRSMVDALEQYRLSQDPVVAFIEAMCVVGNDKSVARPALGDAYHRWTTANHITSGERLGQHDLYEEMRRRFDERKTNGGFRFFGIGLR